MLKPDSLRRALTDAVTVLKPVPRCCGYSWITEYCPRRTGTSLSFESATRSMIVTDFTVILTCPRRCWRGCGNQPDTTTDAGCRAFHVLCRHQ